MAGVALTAAVIMVTLLLAIAAYRRGTGRRHALLPIEVAEELVEHKLGCLREPPGRVELELSLLLGVKPGSVVREHDRAPSRLPVADARAGSRGLPR